MRAVLPFLTVMQTGSSAEVNTLKNTFEEELTF